MHSYTAHCVLSCNSWGKINFIVDHKNLHLTLNEFLGFIGQMSNKNKKISHKGITILIYIISKIKWSKEHENNLHAKLWFVYFSLSSEVVKYLKV